MQENVRTRLNSLGVEDVFLKAFNKIEILDNFVRDKGIEKKNILCGDLNIAPFEDDVWSHKSLENVVSHSKIERDKLIKIIKNGKWIDCVREFINPPKNVYTWWSYRSPDFTKNNRGRRLDHIWISESMAKDLKGVQILKEFRKLNKPSDHVPIIIDLKI